MRAGGDEGAFPGGLGGERGRPQVMAQVGYFAFWPQGKEWESLPAVGLKMVCDGDGWLDERGSVMAASPTAVIDEKWMEETQSAELADMPPEHELQQAVELAAEICGAPMSLVSLLDDHWQTVLASVGLRVKQVRRDITVCHHTMEKNDLLVIDDMMMDMRFAGHPMVTGDPEIRFYAGLPLTAPNGRAIGTLCVIDVKPRRLTRTQEQALRVLANQIKTSMELRAEHRILAKTLAERDRATARLHANERLFQAFMNNGPLISYVKDAGGRYQFYNSRMAEQCHITMQEWIGRTDMEVFPEQMAKIYRSHDVEALEAGRLTISTDTFRTTDGVSSTWRSYKFPCDDEEGRTLLAGFSFDVTEELQRQEELTQAKAELERLGSIDPLTGLQRRQVFDERLVLEFEGAQMRRQTLSLVVIDVDNIRQRNQRMGNEAGDAALKSIGSILKECITEADLAVRFGGAEFALLLPETTADEAKALAERVQREMRKVDWGIVPVTLSIGIATNHDAKRGGRQMFCFGDDAMYSAKASGKNRVVAYEPR